MRHMRLHAFRRGASGVSSTARVALLVGVLIAVLVSCIVFAQGRHSAHAVAELQASDLADALRQRVGLAHAYLRATAGRLRGSETPTREQFESFTASLGPQPIVDSLIWMPVVAGADRAAFERTFLPTGVTVSDLRDGGERVSAGNRPTYQPVAYYSGDARLRFLEGVDFLGEADLRVAAARASATGTVSMTPVVEVAGSPFVALVLPVEPGRQSGVGEQPLVGAVLALDNLLTRGRVRRAAPDIALIADVTDRDHPRRLFPLPGEPAYQGDDLVMARLVVAGREWEVAVPVSYAGVYELAGLTLLGGLILTGLIGLFADRGHHLLISDDLQRAVDRQTAALQRSTAEFRALFEEGGAGKCELVPGTGHFRRVNLRLCAMLGYERSELEQRTFRTVLRDEPGGSPDPGFEELLRGERDSYFAERRFLTSSGEELWGEVSATVLRDPVGRPVWIVAVVQDVTPRKQAEEARQLLVRELAHRVKNTLQLARSLADQTARYVGDLPSFMVLYQSRLHALALAHDHLFKTSWAGADLKDLVTATLGPYSAEAGDRIEIDVPPQRLSSAETQTVALLVNELATNASKYGALSNDRGHIVLRAHVEAMEGEAPQGAEQLVFEWDEDAGRKVEKPSKRGFGMTFLTRAVAHQHDGAAHVDWKSRGVCYRFVIPLHPVAQDEAEAAA